MIASYFGEKNINTCETCDFCREKRKFLINEEEENKIIELIKIKLKAKALLASELQLQMPEEYKLKSAAVIRMLLDDGTLFNDKEERLSIKKN